MRVTDGTQKKKVAIESLEYGDAFRDNIDGDVYMLVEPPTSARPTSNLWAVRLDDGLIYFFDDCNEVEPLPDAAVYTGGDL